VNLSPPECIYDPTCVAAAGDAFDRPALSSCLGRAAATPLDVFVTNRAPATLVVGRTTPAVNAISSSEAPSFYDSISVTFGPSRVSVGNVIVGVDAGGEPTFERRVFAVCFDSRRIFVYDPDRRRIDTEIGTGRGPYAIAIDPIHAHLYVAHFTDSFIGVVSLDRRFTRTYGKMIGTLGVPSPPRESK
jgi:DNA-binding beta-propeller fold protein YncE